MIGGFLSALIVAAGVGLAVWTSTGDPWVTGQAMGGAVVCAIGLGLAFDVLSKFGSGRDPVIDDTASLTPPSPTWLVPGLSSGDGSERHLRTRTHPALRELARRMILDQHQLDLDDPEHRPEVERLLGSDIERLLRHDGAEHLGRSRKDAGQSITAIVEGLEQL